MGEADRPSLQIKHLTTARRALADLRKGDTNPETLHRLRTHLRRLQAYLELIGEGGAASVLGECVSQSSRLRALQVFHGYLAKRHATRHDLREVKRRIGRRHARLLKSGGYHQVEERLFDHAMPFKPLRDEWVSHHLDALRQEHAQALRRLHTRLQTGPRRKRLHRLRLRIKTIRYQEEWILDSPFGRPKLVERLKRIQGILGTYEDYAQFRKWARRWDLDMRSQIQEEWRIARRRAHRIGQTLEALIDQVASHRLWLVPRHLRARG